jgi:hypothetical protein
MVQYCSKGCNLNQEVVCFRRCGFGGGNITAHDAVDLDVRLTRPATPVAIVNGSMGVYAV